jgi:hypothetical protein
MANTPVSLALEKIKEQIAALNFASDAIMALRDSEAISEIIATIRLRRLSARRTDLRDQRMTLILTQTVSEPPSAAQISDLRAKVKALYQLNVTAAALDDIIAAAIEIANS